MESQRRLQLGRVSGRQGLGCPVGFCLLAGMWPANACKPASQQEPASQQKAASQQANKPAREQTGLDGGMNQRAIHL